jgi:hypothetical protein
MGAVGQVTFAPTRAVCTEIAAEQLPLRCGGTIAPARRCPAGNAGGFVTPKEANMANTTLTRCTAVAGLAAALSLVAVTTGSADPQWGRAAVVGAGVGLAVGAAAATAAASPYYNSYGGQNGYGAGYYDYDPDAVIVAPAGYYDSAVAPDWSYARPGICRLSIRGC